MSSRARVSARKMRQVAISKPDRTPRKDRLHSKGHTEPVRRLEHQGLMEYMERVGYAECMERMECTEQMGRMECTEGMEFMEHARHKVRQGRLAHPHWRRDPSPRHLPCRPLSPGEQYRSSTGKRSCCRLSGRAMRNDLLSRGCLSGAEAGNPAPP